MVQINAWYQMQQIDHLHWFSMYLSTNAIQWKCWILHSRCEMWDKFSSIVSGIDLNFSGAIYRTRNAKNDHLADLQCIQVQIAPDGNARYCIPNARCEMSFWHSFQHWFITDRAGRYSNSLKCPEKVSLIWPTLCKLPKILIWWNFLFSQNSYFLQTSLFHVNFLFHSKTISL